MTALPLPFPRSYWVAPSRLVAGCYPGDLDEDVARKKLGGLVAVGVTRIVSLMEAEETDREGQAFVDYRPIAESQASEAERTMAFDRFGIPDLGIPSVSLMTTVLDAIDREIGKGGCVFVHCWGGKGRTGTVIGCWLMRHGRALPTSIFPLLAQMTSHNRAAFPHIPQTEEQRSFVQQWRAGQ